MMSEPQPGQFPIRQLDEYAIAVIVKVLLGTLLLLCHLVLVGYLPGVYRHVPEYPVSFVLYSVVTVGVIGIVFTGGGVVISFIEEPFSRTVVSVTRLLVTLLAVLMAYVGVGFAVQLLFVESGIGLLYPFAFVVIGVIPLALIGLHLVATLYWNRRDEESARAGDEERNQATDDVDRNSSLDAPIQSDESVILQRLEERDGSTRQGALAESTEWSASKVSRVLSRMEERDVIERYQLGREKIVCLPGRAPEFVRQPNGPADKEEPRQKVADDGR